MVIMKKVLIKVNNGILRRQFLPIYLTIHFNSPNGIEFSFVVRHSMEEFDIPVTLLHSLLFGSLPLKKNQSNYTPKLTLSSA